MTRKMVKSRNTKSQNTKSTCRTARHAAMKRLMLTGVSVAVLVAASPSAQAQVKWTAASPAQGLTQAQIQQAQANLANSSSVVGWANGVSAWFGQAPAKAWAALSSFQLSSADEYNGTSTSLGTVGEAAQRAGAAVNAASNAVINGLNVVDKVQRGGRSQGNDVWSYPAIDPVAQTTKNTLSSTSSNDSAGGFTNLPGGNKEGVRENTTAGDPIADWVGANYGPIKGAVKNTTAVVLQEVTGSPALAAAVADEAVEFGDRAGGSPAQQKDAGVTVLKGAAVAALAGVSIAAPGAVGKLGPGAGPAAAVIIKGVADGKDPGERCAMRPSRQQAILPAIRSRRSSPRI